ncbi:MAG: hypothetical protein Sapg2KO_31240 [Saprospiraceae bacterium]
MKRLLIWISLFFFFTPGHTQSNIDFGILGGISLYSGDLSPEDIGFSFSDLGPAAGAFVRFQFTDWVGLRTGLTYAHLGTEDARSALRNRAVSFETDIFELSGIIEISPFNIGYYSSEAVIVPYLAIGIGAFRFNPQTEVNGQMIDLQPLGTEGQGLPGYPDRYSLNSINFPFGLGVRFVISDQLSVGLDVIGRKLQTDYIDDVSSISVRYGDILENKGVDVARISAPSVNPDSASPDLTYQRGGPFNDFFYIASLNVSYRISSGSQIYKPGKKGISCPRF